MPSNSPNLVKIEQVGDCVQRVIDDLNKKLWQMNQRGHYVEMPEEMAFDMNVLVEFEALISTEQEISENTQTDGGFSIQRDKTGSAEINNNGESRKTDDRNAHLESGLDVTTFFGA